MSDKMKNCCNRLKDEVHHVEEHLSGVGKHLKSAAETEVDGLEKHLANAKENLVTKKAQSKEVIERVNQFLIETTENTVTKLQDLKVDYEINKIEKQADKKEQHAIDAIALAALSCLEAEIAIMEAVKARKLATDVAG